MRINLIPHKSLLDTTKDIRIGKVVLRYVLDAKLITIDTPHYMINEDDPTPLDIAKYALYLLSENKTRLVDVILNSLGLRITSFTTTSPCDEWYKTEIDREIKRFIAVQKKKKRKMYRTHYGGYEELIAWGIAIDNEDVTYIARYYYDFSYDIRNSSKYVELVLLPLEPVKINVSIVGERVICGPNGYANKYKRSFTYVFPPAYSMT